MSRIYFHSPSGEAELRGSERAYMGSVTSDILWAFLSWAADGWGDVPPLLLVLPDAPDYLSKPDLQKDALRVHLRVGYGQRIEVGSVGQSAFEVGLNTVLALGGAPLRLMARLHGQCEIHCWCEGANRRWLADIIQEGRKTGLYRAEQGWGKVMSFLRQTGTEPVVCSYSVTEAFPGPHVVDRHLSEDEHEAWWNKPGEEQWAEAMSALRAQRRGLELKPDGWDDFRFGAGLDALQAAGTIRERLAHARLAD